MSRLVATCFFLTATLLTANCEAQSLGLLKRVDQANPQWYKPRLVRQRPTRGKDDWLPLAERLYQSRNWSHDYANPASPLPKYIGGFHSSHFYNLGIPNGDIGFRGNGIYWAPW